MPSFEGFIEGVEREGYWCFEEAFGILISKVAHANLDYLLAAGDEFELDFGKGAVPPLMLKTSSSNSEEHGGCSSSHGSSQEDVVNLDETANEVSMTEMHNTTSENLNSSSLEKSPAPRKNQHSYPNWLPDLCSNFQDFIVSNCSTMTKEAVAKNEVLKVSKAGNLAVLFCLVILQGRDHRDVKEEILNSMTKYLKTLFTKDDLPGFVSIFT